MDNFHADDGNMTGLTLLELMLTMAIIAILAVALWGNFFPSLIKGRDSRRKQDLESVSRALELYYNDNKAYPTALPSWAAPFANPNDTTVIYMPKLPSDPSSGATYCYTSDSSYYKLYANLENTQDPKVIPTVACSSVDYNYGIASPNTTP